MAVMVPLGQGDWDTMNDIAVMVPLGKGDWDTMKEMIRCHGAPGQGRLGHHE